MCDSKRYRDCREHKETGTILISKYKDNEEKDNYETKICRSPKLWFNSRSHESDHRNDLRRKNQC